MTIKSDKWIYDKACNENMITPFYPEQVRTYKLSKKDIEEGYTYKAPDKVISYGLSSYGYDIQCANEFKIFTNVNNCIVDPKNFDEKSFVDFEGNHCIIPPNSFALARSIEYVKIPTDVIAICVGKSTYARIGIIVNVTPIEPGFEGHITLEFSNTTPLPAKIYANEGIAQLLFFQSDEQCSTTYADRKGKYQGQTGITLPKL